MNSIPSTFILGSLVLFDFYNCSTNHSCIINSLSFWNIISVQHNKLLKKHVFFFAFFLAFNYIHHLIVPSNNVLNLCFYSYFHCHVLVLHIKIVLLFLPAIISLDFPFYTHMGKFIEVTYNDSPVSC